MIRGASGRTVDRTDGRGAVDDIHGHHDEGNEGEGDAALLSAQH